MPANSAFGIDHPLVAVHDLPAVRARLCQLGFTMTPVGRHPWGTDTTLAVFDGCLLEIMGIGDTRLLDAMPAGDFRFGRHVHEHLQQREGVALTALHSRQIDADSRRAVAAGWSVSGTIEFGRDVTLPDGSADRTRTSLTLMPDTRFPRLSLFLCQQHKPELLYRPAWMAHPNTVRGIDGITILAAGRDQQALAQKLGAIYGAAQPLEHGFSLQTANGRIDVVDADGLRQVHGEHLPDLSDPDSPYIVAMSFHCQDLQTLAACAEEAGLPLRRDGRYGFLGRRELFGNMLFSFTEQQP